MSNILWGYVFLAFLLTFVKINIFGVKWVLGVAVFLAFILELISGRSSGEGVDADCDVSDSINLDL